MIAHEVGHHVQNLIGILPKFNQMRQRMDEAEANQMSVRVELQADCFAGIWGHFTDQKGILEKGDVEEALNAAQQIGDDTLQRRRRAMWCRKASTTAPRRSARPGSRAASRAASLQDCDTFNNPI